MRTRLGVLVRLFFLLVIAGGAARATEPLTAGALGEGATLSVRSKLAGLEVSFLPGAGVPRRWTLSLLAPRGASSSEVVVTFPAVQVAPLTVMLPRPTRDVPDGDLRLHLEARGLDLVGLAAPWLQAPRLRIFGDDTVYAGSRYAPRVVVTFADPAMRCVRAPCERPLEGARVEARLVARDGKKETVLARAEAPSDGSGSAALALAIPTALTVPTAPTALTGKTAELVVVVVASHEDGLARAEQPLHVITAARVLLSTDKPIYQPGQRIHLRLLAKDRGTGRAAGGAQATFAVFDAKGNKVFQKLGVTSPEGVFASAMDVATMVNIGRWRITAKVGGDEVERTVEVKPYVLPKFKVQLAPERAAYKPGETVKGQVDAVYFFGEPLRRAKVELVAETFDVGPRTLAKVALTLDGAGSARFDFELPTMLAGQPLLQGGAAVQLTARVTDTAGQTQEVKKALTIYQQALRITALPEAGRLVPGVDNAVFFVVTTPDGRPAARAELTFDGAIGGARGSISADANGIAEWHVTPPSDRDSLTLDVVAQLPDGATARQSVVLAAQPAADVAVLLRPLDPSPRAGDRLELEVYVRGAVPFVFVDLVKDGQTLQTLSAPVKDGRARLATSLAPELAGTVLAHAYAIGHDMDVYADTRPLVVRAADELRVEVLPRGTPGDKPFWAPGERATIGLRVTDRAGHPVLAALGLWAVDEAVFSLSELQPGMEQVFFLLEQEIMKPKVEVHGFEPDAVYFGPPARDLPLEAGRPARVLAAAAMPTFSHGAVRDSQIGEAAERAARWQALFEARATHLRSAVRAWVREEWRSPSGRELRRILGQAGVKPDVTRDWFGVAFRVDVDDSSDEVSEASLLSAGVDATWNTADDLSAPLGVEDAMRPVWELRERQEMRRWRRLGGVGAEDVAVLGMARVQASRAFAFDDDVPKGEMVMGPPAPPADLPNAPRPDTATPTTPATPTGPAAAPPRLRSYFPETLYVNPLVLTDANGLAQVDIDLADSITTWRLSALASDRDGRLGSTSAGLKVFQDFFVDVAFPAALTRNDRVTVPVAVYNYLPVPQTVELTLVAEGGLTLDGPATASLALAPNEVKGLQVPLFAGRVGQGRLTVSARGAQLADAVRREVRIEPDGFPVATTESGLAADPIELVVDVPEGAIDRATTVQLKLYPGLFAQVVDGLENMLKVPSGCFEQTSSTTFPNILVLRYLRDAKKSKPELEATALRYLQAGWQRLVTFEVAGGGFSWFGDAPANKVLTAYGLMEFEDMDKVYGVDRQVIARTRAWLVAQQRADGSFVPDPSHLHEESWGDIQKSSLLVSAYITWALAHTDGDGPPDAALKKALAYLGANLDRADDAYVLAYLANAFVEGGDKASARRVLGKLAGLAVKDGKGVYFPTQLRTATYGSGEAATIEVTALALRALMAAGEHLELVKPGLEWLTQRKDQLGNWQTTQATIQVLQAMVASLSAAAEPVAGNVEVRVNGAVLTTATYTAADFDVVRFVDLSAALQPGKNTVRVTPSAGLKPMFALTRTAYLPWGDARQPTAQAFDVKVTYDRTTLAKDDLVGVRVEVRSNLPGKADMGIVDVAVPPGFEVLAEDLERAVADGTIQRFSIAGRQLVLYVPAFTPGAPFVVDYRVRARFPVRAATGSARAYEYYDPDHLGLAAPEQILVE